LKKEEDSEPRKRGLYRAICAASGAGAPSRKRDKKKNARRR